MLTHTQLQMLSKLSLVCHFPPLLNVPKLTGYKMRNASPSNLLLLLFVSLNMASFSSFVMCNQPHTPGNVNHWSFT